VAVVARDARVVVAASTVPTVAVPAVPGVAVAVSTLSTVAVEVSVAVETTPTPSRWISTLPLPLLTLPFLTLPFLTLPLPLFLALKLFCVEIAMQIELTWYEYLKILQFSAIFSQKIHNFII
jgi:hypothetical protein